MVIFRWNGCKDDLDDSFKGLTLEYQESGTPIESEEASNYD